MPLSTSGTSAARHILLTWFLAARLEKEEHKVKGKVCTSLLSLALGLELPDLYQHEVTRSITSPSGKFNPKTSVLITKDNDNLLDVNNIRNGCPAS